MFFKTKYPVVRQYDQIDCAPACLLSVLRYYKGNDSLVHIRELCQTNSHGSSMLSIVQAAQKLGFRARGARGGYEDLIKEAMPCIAHVILKDKLQHFIVIYKINKDHVLAGDPGRGLIKIPGKEFQILWQQKSVILLKPNSVLNNKSCPAWYSWLLNYIKHQQNWIFQSLFLGITYTLLGLLTAVFIQLLIDQFIPGQDVIKIGYTAATLFILLIIRAFAGYLRQKFSVEINKRISLNINRDFIIHLFKLPKKFFDTRKIGDVTARIHDSIRIQQAVLLVSNTTIIDSLIILGSIAFIFYFSSLIGWLTLFVVPFYGLILWFNSRKLKQQQNQVMKNYARVESAYIDSLSGIDEIFNFNSSAFFTKLNQSIFKTYQHKIEALGLTRSKLGLLAELSSTAIVTGLLFCSAFVVINGQMLLGEMMASYSLIANMLPSINRLVDANISLQGASIASQRLLDMLYINPQKVTGHLTLKRLTSLTIKNGFFAWPGGKELFSGINLQLKKGEISALWGISGSGKSTLVQLLQRKYDLQSGEILIDSVPVHELNLADYRKNIALVPQHIKIFNGTLAENIMCGRESINSGDIYAKIEMLHLESFLHRFEQGLFTLLGEDNRQLSGGEKQILGLIRALFEQPEVLIIDEGLNAIDLERELEIHRLLQSYAENHIILLISHNLKTILKARQINILHQGRIIQSGTAEDLINNNGYFNYLWQIYHQNNGKEVHFA